MGVSVNLNIPPLTYRDLKQCPTLLTLVCPTYFWTVGWDFMVATEADPPTAVEGSWFSAAWFSGRNFLRIGFDGGWEYVMSWGYKTKQNQKVKKLNAPPLMPRPHVSLRPSPRSGLCCVPTLHVRICGWFMARQEWERHRHQIPMAFLSSFFSCLQHIISFCHLEGHRNQNPMAYPSSFLFSFKMVCVSRTTETFLTEDKIHSCLTLGLSE